MTKKICLVGGEDVHKRIPLSRYLMAAGFDVTIVGTSSLKFPENVHYQHYNLIRRFSPLSDYKTILWLKDFFNEHHFDIIHTFDTKPAFLVPLALLKSQTPITRTITGLGTIFMSSTAFSSVLRLVYKTLHKKVRQRVFNTVFQNKDDRDLYLKSKLISENKQTLIYSSGIELDDFKEKALRKGNPFTFICVARLVFEKGIVNYLEAARLCINKGYDFKFLLVGPLEENSNKLNESILKSYDDVVDSLGQRQDIKQLLLGSDAFVLPTFREGFSRVLLEAAAIGLPIISTQVTGVKDFVEHKKEALLINPKDSEALANAMIELATNETLAQELVENALIKVERYSLKNVSNQYITIFEKAINHNKK